MARFLIIAGIVILLVGLVLQFAPGLMSWFGHLPGDIRIKGEKYSIFIPITSMVVISLIITVVINLFFRR